MASQFRGTARTICRTDTAEGLRVEYCYHKTAVVRSRPDGTVALHSGGWRTATTKRAINQALEDLGRPERVSQHDFAWFVGDVPFHDGIVLAA